MIKKFKIDGMDCTSCALLIEAELEDAGFKSKCSYAAKTLEVELVSKTDEEKVRKAVKSAGYNLLLPSP